MSTTDTNVDQTDAGPDSGGGDEQLGDAGRRALEHERQARREAERMLREAQGRVAQLEAAEAERTAEAEREQLRADVAEAKGLTPSQAKRLAGATREEMEADADDLLDAFKADDAATRRPPSARPVADLRGGGDPTSDPEPTPSSIADSILTRGV